MWEQTFSRVIVSIALLACFLCVSQIPRHKMLPGGGPRTYRNQPGSRSQTFSRNPQNLVLPHISEVGSQRLASAIGPEWSFLEVVTHRYTTIGMASLCDTSIGID